MGGHEGFGFFGGGLMWLFWLALIVLVVVIVSSSVTNWGRCSDNGDGGVSALEILKQRYARGEIERDEYERRRRDLIG